MLLNCVIIQIHLRLTISVLMLLLKFIEIQYKNEIDDSIKIQLKHDISCKAWYRTCYIHIAYLVYMRISQQSRTFLCFKGTSAICGR